jgi:hypothetical protein
MSGLDRLTGAISRLKEAALIRHWASSTKAFAYDSGICTIDEHDDQRKPLPHRDDFDLFWSALDRNEDIWTIKSRQNMVSWALRISDLRLVLFRANAKVALVFDDKEDGIDHIENRIKPMFESLPEWFRSLYTLREVRGLFVIETFSGEKWRSYIEPIARGSNKLRSRTYTRIDWEEAATQDWMEEAYMGAKPTVQGKRDLSTGKIRKGQIVIVSTPIPDTYYLKLGGRLVDHAVSTARGDRPPDKDIALPVSYMARWKNEFGFTCFAWYELSDPAKDRAWQEQEAAKIPGGMGSDYWQQEHEMNTHVLRGRATYWAFQYDRNVIDQLPAPPEQMRTWTIFLSADFGATDPTCWLFWAEEPFTKTLVVWDEIYLSNTPILEIKKLIYAKLRAFAGINPDDPFEARQVIRYAVGDPQGKGYMQEYCAQPYPVPVGGNPPDSLVKVNDRLAGETRINNFFSVQFNCCGEVYFLEHAICPRCKRPHRGRPRLLIYGPNCPETVAQIPRQRKLVPTNPELEVSQRDVKIPDHAVDALKYGAMTRMVQGAPVQNFVKKGEAEQLSHHEQRFFRHLGKVMERAVERQDQDVDAAIEAYRALTFGMFRAYGEAADETDEVEAWS